jgi:hypothetical protein
MDGEPSAIATAIRDILADPDRGLFETLIGRNLNIDDDYTHNMTMYGTSHDVVINSIQIFDPPFMRDDPRRWTFGFRTRYMPLEFLSALARRFECVIEHYAESHADTDSWSHIFARYNRHGAITYTGQTPPPESPLTSVYRSHKSQIYHERISDHG